MANWQESRKPRKLSYKPAGRTLSEVRCFRRRLHHSVYQKSLPFGNQASICCISKTIITSLIETLSSHSGSWRHHIQEFTGDFTIPSSVLFKSKFKEFFAPQQNLMFLISFPCNGHQQNNFCVVISKAPAETIDCLTE